MLNIIKSLYSNIKSRVKFNNTLSETFECHLGVFQGDSLSPLIISLYVYKTIWCLMIAKV